MLRTPGYRKRSSRFNMEMKMHLNSWQTPPLYYQIPPISSNLTGTLYPNQKGFDTVIQAAEIVLAWYYPNDDIGMPKSKTYSVLPLQVLGGGLWRKGNWNYTRQ